MPTRVLTQIEDSRKAAMQLQKARIVGRRIALRGRPDQSSRVLHKRFALSLGIIARELGRALLTCLQMALPPEAADDGVRTSSEMAERRLRKDERLAVRAKKAGFPLPSRHGADLADQHTRRRGLLAQRFDLASRYAGQNLVIVATRDDP